MAKTLELIFVNSDGKNKTISIQNPKNGVTKQQAHDAMNAVITADVFASGDNGKLVSIRKAQLREVTIQELA